jgi:hypothetical protein
MSELSLVELILKKEMIRLHKKRLMGKQKRDGIGSGRVVR